MISLIFQYVPFRTLDTGYIPYKVLIKLGVNESSDVDPDSLYPDPNPDPDPQNLLNTYPGQ